MSIALPKNIATYDPTKSGNDIKLYNDASQNKEGTSGAFADIHDSILEAQYFIFIAGWSFHPYMHLRRDSPPKELTSLGALLIQQACTQANMVIAIHTWDHTNITMSDWQNDDGDEVLDLLTKKLWGADVLMGECDQKEIKRERPKNFLWRASSRRSLSNLPWSHHQKFVVLDSPGSDSRRQIKVFFGGLDLTKGRFDWPKHPILPTDEDSKPFREQDVRERPNAAFYQYDDWRNPEFEDDRQMVRQPWHDIHAQLVGSGAWDFVREFVGRWIEDPARNAQGNSDPESIEKVIQAFLALLDAKKFVQQWEPTDGKWAAQVFRSMSNEHWGHGGAEVRKIVTPSQKGKRREFKWALTGNTESSISEAYLKAIRSAERFIYIETQYLIGSGKHWNRKRVRNSIPEGIVEQIFKLRGKSFHAYIVIPMFPEGDPISSPLIAQRQFEWATIDYMIRSLKAKLGSTWRDHLSFYFLANWNNVDSLRIKGTRKDRVTENKRYMIYVHSKFMIVDDLYLIVGSANLNERSLAGDRDTEIAVGLWPAPGQQEACMEEVKKFRQQLWEEHLGENGMPSQWEQPESEVCVGEIQQAALQNYTQFCLGKKTNENGHLCMWRINATGQGIEFPCVAPAQSPACSGWGQHIPDGVFNKGQFDSRWQWLWIPKGESFITSITKMTKLAE